MRLVSLSRGVFRSLIASVGAACAVLSFPALAQSPLPQNGGIERFYVSVPEGWTEVIRSRQQGADVLAYVPPGQTAERWTDMFTIQVYQGMAALPVESYYERTLSNYRNLCDGVKEGQLQSGQTNGYAAAFWVMACGRNQQTGIGEVSFFRLVQGEKALYIAQRSWHTQAYADTTSGPPVSPEDSQVAVETLRSFGVCNQNLPQRHPCPELKGEGQK